MARDARDREDLLREATGLVARVELRLRGKHTETVVCGFRPRGELSIFWGQDEVAQFNCQAEFRRGYSHGKLVASYQRQLYWLLRNQQGGRTRLRREAFSTSAATQFIHALEEALHRLQGVLVDQQQYELVGEVPTGANVVTRVADWLQHHASVRLALHPGLAREP